MKKVTLIAPLSNIKINIARPLDLGANVTIDSFRNHLLPIMQDAFVKGFMPRSPGYSCLLVIRNAESIQEDASDLQDEIDEALLRLRLFKSGGVGYNYIIADQHGWYDAPVPGTQIQYVLIGRFFYNVWEREGMPSTLELNPEDAEPLKALFALTADLKLMKKPAFRYFFRSYHEPYATDRFLSNAIGLENLLVNDTKDRSNYRYKFADRGSFLLQQAGSDPAGPEVYFKGLQDIYDGRSQVVHSNENSDRDWHKASDIKRLQNSETYLRHLLLYVLHHPELEKSDEVDKRKRQRYV